jgi:hypothetical protein
MLCQICALFLAALAAMHQYGIALHVSVDWPKPMPNHGYLYTGRRREHDFVCWDILAEYEELG